MRQETCTLGGQPVDIILCNTAVVGSGAAGFNAADRLFALGQRDVVLITEGLNQGTSRNTGSDKQTYYKLTLSGDGQDSVRDMAQTLFDGGAMDGDIALCEAACSARSFYKLVEIGVPFPHNPSGAFVGYKTDHDPRQRATSAGPLTSRFMTEKLENEVLHKGIPILDGCQVVRILTHAGRCIGLLCVRLDAAESPEKRFVLISATNVIYATGGPAGLYESSVFPQSQSGATGLAFEAGALGKNLTEWQYGIASIDFRWNLSGTYQQVLPRYVSTNAAGQNPIEFLPAWFSSPTALLRATFLKGYQWPFDPRKLENEGSSLIDVLVYNEIHLKKRRVFLDFRENPACLAADFSNLDAESHAYLEKSGALFGTPIERLAHMNRPAIELYKNNGIDLAQELLEIDVCAQHNNGGLAGDHWWQSNLSYFFPVGEVNGSHGVYRPGGSALNAGQCGGLRAATYIAARHQDAPLEPSAFLSLAQDDVLSRMRAIETMLANVGQANVLDRRTALGRRMSLLAAHIRTRDGLAAIRDAARAELLTYWQDTVLVSPAELSLALSGYDLTLAQYVYASAMLDYHDRGGTSRGSYMVAAEGGVLAHPALPPHLRFLPSSAATADTIQEALYERGEVRLTWRPVRPIPADDEWFENVWNAYRRDEIVR